jgi:aminoglycoside 6'-N-acetyltransferase I
MSQITEHSIPVLIRPARPDDAETWERLRCELWPDGREDHAEEIAAFFAGTTVEPDAVFIVEDPEGNAIAFAELSVRTNLPTLVGTRVGYVEGLYVVPEARGSGVTRALLRASRDWARRQNCAAFASDRAERVIIDKSFSAE